MNTSAPNPPARWKRILFGRHPRRALLRVFSLTLATYVLVQFILVPIKVVGDSMLPNYHNGRLNVVNKLAYLHSPPRRWDVVAVRSVQSYVLLKRVVALPGETIAIRRGRILINGQPLEELYTHSKAPHPLPAFTLGPDEYFVIGDNREISVFGSVNQSEILGKVLF